MPWFPAKPIARWLLILAFSALFFSLYVQWQLWSSQAIQNSAALSDSLVISIVSGLPAIFLALPLFGILTCRKDWKSQTSRLGLFTSLLALLGWIAQFVMDFL